MRSTASRSEWRKPMSTRSELVCSTARGIPAARHDAMTGSVAAANASAAASHVMAPAQPVVIAKHSASSEIAASTAVRRRCSCAGHSFGWSSGKPRARTLVTRSPASRTRTAASGPAASSFCQERPTLVMPVDLQKPRSSSSEKWKVENAETPSASFIGSPIPRERGPRRQERWSGRSMIVRIVPSRMAKSRVTDQFST